jgi:hypothetical protein
VSHIIDLPVAVAQLFIPLVLSNLRQAIGGAYTASRYDHLTFAESGASLVSVLPVMAGTALGVKIRRHIFPFLIFSMVIASAVDLIVAPLLPSVAFFASTGQP